MSSPADRVACAAVKLFVLLRNVVYRMRLAIGRVRQVGKFENSTRSRCPNTPRPDPLWSPRLANRDCHFSTTINLDSSNTGGFMEGSNQPLQILTNVWPRNPTLIPAKSRQSNVEPEIGELTRLTAYRSVRIADSERSNVTSRSHVPVVRR